MNANLVPSISYIVLLSVAFTIIRTTISSILAFLKHRNPHRQDYPGFRRPYLCTLAHLCRVTYLPVIINQNNEHEDCIVPEKNIEGVDRCDDGSIRITVRGKGLARVSFFYILETKANNSIWIFKPTQNSVICAKWVIAFRGTHVLADVITDINLARSVAINRDSGLDQALEKCFRLLRDIIIPENGISHGDSILLLGHSLGATLAEAMLLFLRRERYSSVSAYGFDSPGLPEYFRSRFPPLRHTPSQPHHDAAELTLVYALDNAVNNLTPAPTGAVSYRVGDAEPFAIESIYSYLYRLRNIASAAWDISVGSMHSHNLVSMAKLLEDGRIHSDSATAACCYSGKVLQFLDSICTQFLFGIGSGFVSLRAFLADGETRRQVNSSARADNRVRPKRTRSYHSSSNAFPEFTEVADALDHFEGHHKGNTATIPKPYKVSDVQAFARKLDPARDIVCPFIGLTSVGKTSLLKAIFNLPPDDNLLRVSSEMDVTHSRSVMLWKIFSNGDREYRMWLMDIPGVHGSEQSQNASSNEVNLGSQLYALRIFVQAACFVTGDNPTNEAKQLFREVCRALEDRVFVVQNYKHTVRCEKELKRLREESRTAYGDILRDVVGRSKNLVVKLTKVYRCNGATSEDLSRERGITDLRETLSRWMQERCGKIVEEVRRAQGEEREAISRDLWWSRVRHAVGIGGGVAGVGILVLWHLYVPL